MLYWSDLRLLCDSGGPCITITLPVYHPGAREFPFSTNLKSAVRVDEQVLIKKDVPDAEILMAPLRALAKELELPTCGRARVIFDSPDVFRQFYLPGPVALRTVVGKYFHVLSFLDQLCVDRQFYILGLNEEHLRLLHYSDGECEEMPLPAELPKNAQVAGEFTAPDHMLRDASPAGQSGEMRSAVVFSTSTEREKAHVRLHEFFRLVDRGLSKVLGKEPLLLSGVGYEVAIYRQEAAYPYLMKGCLEGDLHDLSIRQIARRASEYTRSYAGRQAEHQLRLMEEMSRTERTPFDIHRIVKAAEEGRVAKLILRSTEETMLADPMQEAECDSQVSLLNAPAVLSIRHGAEIFILPAGTTVHTRPGAAVFRY
jgi:hypothetical protein